MHERLISAASTIRNVVENLVNSVRVEEKINRVESKRRLRVGSRPGGWAERRVNVRVNVSMSNERGDRVHGDRVLGTKRRKFFQPVARDKACTDTVKIGDEYNGDYCIW